MALRTPREQRGLSDGDLLARDLGVVSSTPRTSRMDPIDQISEILGLAGLSDLRWPRERMSDLEA